MCSLPGHKTGRLQSSVCLQVVLLLVVACLFVMAPLTLVCCWCWACGVSQIQVGQTNEFHAWVERVVGGPCQAVSAMLTCRPSFQPPVRPLS